MRVVSRCSPTLLNEMCRRDPDRGMHRGGGPLGRNALRAQQTAPSSVLQAPPPAGQFVPGGGGCPHGRNLPSRYGPGPGKVVP